MKRISSWFSISILGALILVVGSQVSAAGFGMGGKSNLDISEESRTALQECQNFDTQEERHACAQEVAQKNGFELPVFQEGGMQRGFMKGRHGGMMRQDLPEEVKTAMDACKDIEDISERHTCMQTVREENGLPEFAGKPGMMGRGGFAPEIFEGIQDLTQEQRTELFAEIQQLILKYKSE